ncbi:MAG: signal recognition particle-docking protein FtsY [Actinobacteria bacterium]|nr:signal recognition particle-docking protein FtsY [Actinomycetota bacterium]
MLLVVLIVVAAVIVLAAAGFVLWRRRRPRPTDVRRDAPTVPAPATLEGGLARTRRALGERLAGLFGGRPDAAFWSALEEALLAADVGVAATVGIVDRVRARAPEDAAAARSALRDEVAAVFSGRDRSLALRGDPAVIVVVGVNGSGKTTTIAKLAAQLQGRGLPTLLAAADTFRDAATEQLGVWAERLGVDLVAGQQGGDPAAVAFDARQRARARGKRVLVVDTAGRLHSKHNLMEELGKVVRVLSRDGGEVGEVLLVLDGTTGQNAVAQARAFTAAVGVTGIVLTKLDGTARGGIAVAVEGELGIPVKLVGVGERVEDLLPFDPEAFVDALLGGS